MAFNPLQWCKKAIYNAYHENTAKMLIWTGVTGYVLSSAAQLGAILFNNKLDDKTKSFLLPQECMDAGANILTFLSITTLTKSLVTKLHDSGKWLPKSVREYVEKKPEIVKKIGKIDFKIADYLPKDSELLKAFKACKAKNATYATIGAGIVASSIITPLLRNRTASKVQKNYIAYTKNKENSVTEIKPESKITKNTGNNMNMYSYSGNMKI